MPKRICTGRAEWRLQTGRPAEALSPHYRLDCDYGTPVIICWEKGGNEPIYVCESHAKQLGPSREHGPEARVLADESEQSAIPSKFEDRSQSQVVPDGKVKFSAPPEVPALAAVSEPPDIPIKLQAQSPPPAAADNTLDIAVPPRAAAIPVETPVETTAEVKVARTTADASPRSRPRDYTFGNSAKAMVDEAIWNLATGDSESYRSALQQGKSARDAAQAAGGQLAVIHQKINDYAQKLEIVLSESKATISVVETIDKPLEQAMLEIIGNGAMSDSEKDAAIQQLGAVQEWVKHGRQGDMTPLQANQILLAIGERLNWGGSSDVSEDCKPVYRALYGNLKAAIRTAVPEAQNLQDRLTNLYAAKADLDRELLTTKAFTSAAR